MAQFRLSARVRDTKGKGVARKLRTAGQIPAAFYGPGVEPLMLALDYPEFQKLLKTTTGENVILDLEIESGGKSDTRKVMLKELQMDPIKDTYLHVDFYEISMDKEITIDIPIRLLNTPAGVEEGGILQHVVREMTISGLPDKLVEDIEVDVSALNIGDAVHIEDISLPEGITALQDEGLTVAVVVAPTVVVEEEPEEEEEIEGEEAEGEEEAPEEEKESTPEE
jgi:large subunit ribosomal protein L25